MIRSSIIVMTQMTFATRLTCYRQDCRRYLKEKKNINWNETKGHRPLVRPRKSRAHKKQNWEIEKSLSRVEQRVRNWQIFLFFSPKWKEKEIETRTIFLWLCNFVEFSRHFFLSRSKHVFFLERLFLFMTCYFVVWFAGSTIGDFENRYLD